uniref:Chemokine interleukin-8-like domain-containing protein n=1 Tax=Cynoglossus semilaevis TaxID=244447 RepID=A0A3P8UG14_CYNSE
MFKSFPSRCCLRYSKRPIRCKLLQGYSHQHITASCDISAIVGGADRFVCADPSQPWTQQCVESVSMFLNVNLNIPLLLFHLLKCVFFFSFFLFLQKIAGKNEKTA